MGAFEEFETKMVSIEKEIKDHYSGNLITDERYKIYYETNERKIIIDGIVNNKEFYNSNNRTMWILKEARDEVDNKSGGYNLVNDLNNRRADGKNRDSWQTFDKIIYTTYAIENKLNNFNEIKMHASNPAIASFLRKIAYINLQKLSATSKSDNNTIRNHMLHHKEILRKQILSISPKIIINASKQNIKELLNETDLKDIVLINCNHPSYYFEKSEKFTNKILGELKNLNKP